MQLILHEPTFDVRAVRAIARAYRLPLRVIGAGFDGWERFEDIDAELAPLPFVALAPTRDAVPLGDFDFEQYRRSPVLIGERLPEHLLDHAEVRVRVEQFDDARRLDVVVETGIFVHAAFVALTQVRSGGGR